MTQQTPTRWLAIILTCAAGWGAVAIFMTFAQSADAMQRGGAGATLADLSQNLFYFLPLVLLSAALHRHFTVRPDTSLKPARMAFVYALTILVFLPAFLIYEAVVTLFFAGQPLADIGNTMLVQSRMGWWIDFMIVTGAFALHAAIAAWLQIRERERSLALEREENLKLRLSLLQGQLEPHFLFNALSGVSALVRRGESAPALTALSQVSDLLRYAVRASRDAGASVADEMKFIEGYLAIQQLRFGDRLRLDLQQGPADWSSIPCPPLLLHPLVENAIRHGLEPRDDACRIDIRLSLEDSMVQFEVFNDMGHSEAGNGVGHAATRQRLTALFGEQGTLTADVEDGRYHATLRFPAGEIA
ncbi:sensor histidine kinase [Gimibacter soli]|uniref:Histidine kinase n=1 Tax=Gimibacter soli TaxID=3024400 RepID=A0AAE9XS15_9PROT|nr:histidine kinase [Gimibacter soli]WCL55252.1 histidine kinase [Gimibacter soli]